MAFASGGFHGVHANAESVFGQAHNLTTMTNIRHTSCSLALAKDSFQSAELRSDRQISDFRHGDQKPAGAIGFELSYAEFDAFLEAALGGTWQAAYTLTGTIGASGAGSNTFYSAAATFTSFATGDVITVVGFTGTTATSRNNITHRITARAAANHTVTVASTLFTKSASAITVTRSPSLIAGTTQRSFSIERVFSDISKYQQFTGCVINTMDISVKPGAIVTGSFGILARAAATTSTAWDSSPTASQTNSPYDSFTGSLKEGGTIVGYVTSIDLKLDNGGTPTYVIGSDKAPAIPLGRSNVTGSLDVYFQDLTMLRKFENETASSVEFFLGSGVKGGQSYRFYLPNVKYSTGDNPATDEKPIVLKMNYQALYSTTERTNIRITKIA